VQILSSFVGKRAQSHPRASIATPTPKNFQVVENKDLDLPNHRTMVATVRCAEIAAGLRAATLESGGWAAATAAAKASHAPAVGAQLDALMFECLQTYDATAAQFDEQVRVCV